MPEVTNPQRIINNFASLQSCFSLFQLIILVIGPENIPMNIIYVNAPTTDKPNTVLLCLRSTNVHNYLVNKVWHVTVEQPNSFISS